MNTVAIKEKLIPAGASQVVRTRIQDKKGFTKQFNQAPALIEQGAAKWPAMELWTMDYLREQLGDMLHPVERYMNGKREACDLLVRDYLDYMHSTTDDIPFYLLNCQLHLGTPMEQHYTVPPFAWCWYKNYETAKEKYALSWLFAGAANTRAALHVDRWKTSAWNAVISGLKLWLFYSPSQADFLYHGAADPFNPDYERWPLLHQATPFVCWQKPGDIVYTPSGWWHTVLNIEPGISITENFINETNCEAVRDFFKEKNRPNSMNTLQQIIDHYTSSANND